MSTEARAQRGATWTFRNSIFGRNLPLETEICFYILVSAMDVFMTCIVLSHQAADGNHFYESNLIANYFFLNWGMPGMVFYKFAMVAFVTLVLQLIALDRVITARRVCSFATGVTSMVVIYSLWLLVQNTSFL